MLSWRVAVISVSKRSMLEIQKWLFHSATAELKNFAGDASALSVLTALAVATLFGFVHALMPGHGKVALVSYYLGHPARFIAGVGTSALLILTHVGSAAVLVLAGFTVIRATLGGAGRAPAFEAASAVSVTAVGIWLLVRSVRHDHSHLAHNAGFLAFATGLVPCPLTTFIMIYSVANGISDGDRHDRNYLDFRGLHDSPARARLAVFRTHDLRPRAHRAYARNCQRTHDRRIWIMVVRNARDLRRDGPWAQRIPVMDTTAIIMARTIAFTATGLPTTIMGIAMITNTVMATDTASSTRRSPVRLAGSGP